MQVKITLALIRLLRRHLPQGEGKRDDRILDRKYRIDVQPMAERKKSYLTPYAQKLRREMTKEERHIWYDFLKGLPITINRQKVIGKYIVDFYCDSKKTIIEIDGSQHFTIDGICETDYLRDAFFSEMGLTVLRYSNYEINTQFESVCEDILKHFNKK